MSTLRVVWKYELMGYTNKIKMPSGAQILCVAEQDSMPHVWVLADPAAPVVVRRLDAFPTGQQFDLAQTGPLEYVTTFFTGPFVWHVFDGGELERA